MLYLCGCMSLYAMLFELHRIVLKKVNNQLFNSSSFLTVRFQSHKMPALFENNCSNVYKLSAFLTQTSSSKCKLVDISWRN